jgi:hypothetical protein
MISSEQDLLFPRFYLARGLEPWLYDTIVQRLPANPTWTL